MNNNEPAFLHDRGGPYKSEWSGISVRDYFAAAALQGVLDCPQKSQETINLYARTAYILADAMLAERSCGR